MIKLIEELYFGDINNINETIIKFDANGDNNVKIIWIIPNWKNNCHSATNIQYILID